MIVKQWFSFLLLFALLRVGWYLLLPMTLADMNPIHYLLISAVLATSTLLLTRFYAYSSDLVWGFSLVGHTLSLDIDASEQGLFFAFLFLLIGICKLSVISQKYTPEVLYFDSSLLFSFAFAINAYALPFFSITFFAIAIIGFRMRYLAIPFIGASTVWLLVVAWRILWGIEPVWSVYIFESWHLFSPEILIKLASPEYLILVGLVIVVAAIYLLMNFIERIHDNEILSMILGVIALFVSIGKGHQELYLALPIAIFLSNKNSDKKFRTRTHPTFRLVPVLLYTIAITLIKVLDL